MTVTVSGSPISARSQDRKRGRPAATLGADGRRMAARNYAAWPPAPPARGPSSLGAAQRCMPDMIRALPPDIFDSLPESRVDPADGTVRRRGIPAPPERRGELVSDLSISLSRKFNSAGFHGKSTRASGYLLIDTRIFVFIC
ncbi:hypothetical protein HPB50_020776 [Hyalomma asiaticum]|uniref:Uncharacterized protein n=1 Tax=Hyalomma asiaticum TaxID=266040 RepID=A0ACB7TN90_HYAAI|nr:hypothetical protein HPB50_020776 [Hyalomma asiaticum]